MLLSSRNTLLFVYCTNISSLYVDPPPHFPLYLTLIYVYFSIIFCCRVKLLINRQTGEAVAMKMVDLKKHSDAVLSVRKEICIQKMLQDQHILRFFGNRSHGNIEYIFLEYAAGGELFDRIGKSDNKNT